MRSTLHRVNALRDHGQVCTRMGAYKPRTNPYSFQGHGKACLPWVFALAGKYGIKVIAMEITHDSHLDEIQEALEKTGKPTLVIALDADQDGNGKGSGRSIAGVDLGAAIIAAKESGLLLAGGGHAMAAGLTIAPDQLHALGDWLDAQLGANVTAAMANQALLLDLALAPRGLTPELVATLESAGPYGMGWPGPRIAVGPVRLIKADIVGNDHLRLIVGGLDGGSFKAIAFRAAQSEMGQALLHGAQGRKIWLAGRAKIDDWGSRPAAELHLDDAGWAD